MERVMPSVPARVQEISINWIRRQVLLVERGYSAVVCIPVMILIYLLSPIVLHFDAAKLVSPELWVWAGLLALPFLTRRTCGGLTSKYLGGLLALQTLLLVAAAALYGPNIIHINFAQIGRVPSRDLLAGALVLVLALLVLGAVILYWFAPPALASIRLLSTRLPPDDVPLPTMTAKLEQTRTRSRAPPSPLKRIATRAQALKVIASLTGLAGAFATLRLIAPLYQDEPQVLSGLAGLALYLGALTVAALLWRRGQRLAAVDANEQLKHDTRAPILYLRSFQDDSVRLYSNDIVLASGALSAKLEKGGALGAFARFALRPPPGQGRLEESLASAVREIGPFVAIGAPTEALPELGAARAYFSNDTWQSAIMRWVDLAGLIITWVGPTKWIRWELDTIIERDALSKLIILMPQGRPDDRAARWQNVTSALQLTRWAPSLAMVDSETVIAIGFLDDGGLSIITGENRLPVDYLLAFHLMLYQLKKSHGPEPACRVALI